MPKLKQKLLSGIKIIKKPEMEILPGHLAFSLVISIVPILTLLVLAASFFSISIEHFINFMIRTFPKDVSNILIPLIQKTGLDFNVGISLLIAILIASNGLYSVITTSNTLYEKENSTTIKRRVKALVLTLLLLFLFVFILIVLAFGNLIVKLLLSILKNVKITKLIYNVFVLLKWPISFIAIFFTINLIYALAPDVPVLSKYTRKGALFTTFSWMIVTAVYSYYVSNIARYNVFYGNLSSLIVMMIWIYILSYIFTIGIALNAQNFMVEQGKTDDKLNKSDKKTINDNNNNDIQ